MRQSLHLEKTSKDPCICRKIIYDLTSLGKGNYFCHKQNLWLLILEQICPSLLLSKEDAKDG